ncbi:MAG: hypothetical protein D6816_15365 [Bacteroidetes bacterium]|nr:MAG: hypothetical protein D6816_15365 [Bacteroidota bacterium]
MANYRVESSTTAIASGDLSAYQYHVVGLNASGETVVYDGAEAANPSAPLGVQQDAPDAQGKASLVQKGGIAKVLVGTAGVTAGKEVQVGTGVDAGKVEDFSPPSAGNSKWILGTALQTRSDGEYVEVEMNISRADNNA